ncbi:MAG: octanoyltransferase [Gemmatimonadetes bacterium]|nr:octanoyltransferase [Gemmatimonadota bacterium]
MAKVTFHGHATCSIETDDGTHLVIDPFFGENPPAFRERVTAAAEFSAENSFPAEPSHKPAPPLVWRHLSYQVHSGARNMALDHALADAIGAGHGNEGVVRLYGWERPTLSLGRNEPAAAYAIESMRGSGFDVVRRPTGGRAVLHDRELTYAVVAPIDGWGGVRAAYLRINHALAQALRSLGAPVDVASGTRSLAPDAGPCFQAPAAGEIVAAGRKLVGSAQARIGSALLQHGSILLEGDQGPLGGVDQSRVPSHGPIGLRELVGDVSIDEVAGAVAESLRTELGGRWGSGELDAVEREAADRLEAETYARDTWTWRR